MQVTYNVLTPNIKHPYKLIWLSESMLHLVLKGLTGQLTVINWQPATVNFGSDNVIYTVTSNLDPVDFNTTTTTATVVLPAFNTDYSFCVDSINTCGATSATPRCATPPVRIEAEGMYATPSWHSCSIIGEAYKFLRDTE